MNSKLTAEKLLAKYLLGDITATEQEQLDKWMKDSPQHEALFKQICDNTSFRKRYEAYTNINSHQAWKYFQKKYGLLSPSNITHYFKYAAILAIPMLMAWMWWQFRPISTSSCIHNLELAEAIQPGKSEATLVSSTHQRQVLVSTEEAIVSTTPAGTAKIRNGALVYTPSSDGTKQAEINHSETENTIENNTLSTRQGNEFKVVFEDGTSVHLNYNTEIRYPVNFGKTKRMVYLKGEAYFKIAKDDRPFYVITDQGSIKQYGTEFNVNTFNPQHTEVALVKGSISITPHGSTQEQFIHPGQLASVQKNETVSIQSRDLTPYVAWNEGRLIFENRPLVNIVEILEHWYNVKITFGSPQLKQLRFTGDMDRYATIGPILKAIARTTNLHIEIKGKNILITDNN